MEMKRKFGNRLRELRIQKGYTQEKLSESIGIQPENYSRIENGLAFPKPENIEKISNVLNIEIAELFLFKQTNNYDEILKTVIDKLKNDEEITMVVYRFLKSMGKVWKKCGFEFSKPHFFIRNDFLVFCNYW